MPRLSALAMLLTLSGCGIFDTAPKFPPICPTLGLLDDAADLTRFNGSGRDITDIVLDGRITAVPAKCVRGAKNQVKTTLQVKLSVARGTAATSRQATIGYVVTVLDGETIIDQQDYAITGSFPPNVERLDLSGPEITLLFPVTATKTAAAYKIFISLRLTPDELATNRKRGQRL